MKDIFFTGVFIGVIIGLIMGWVAVIYGLNSEGKVLVRTGLSEITTLVRQSD